ncbi:MAG: alanine racemase [Candidatus Taylorbacteria bacterium]|nr:alanine racemase [Candidatus Taylorbacteria bacterium]
MQKKLRKGLRTWIEVDKKAIKHNFNTFKKIIPKRCKLLAVVKSNAYGHNLTEFSKEMENLGADFLGVDSITEALALRREKIKTPILVLGYTLPEMIENAISNNISITVSSFETISAIKKIKNKDRLNIHIKVDTGMGRHGFLFSDHEKLIKELKKINFSTTLGTGNVNVEGLFTHFSSAKNPDNLKYTINQFELFKKWTEVFKEAGFNPIIHACATSGTIIFPEAHFDMVRIGIGLYGEWPSKEIKDQILKIKDNKIKLKPVLSWKTIIAEIKKLPKGSKIGYDGTKILEKDSIIAICPIGYWHGYPRVLSSKGFVLVKGKEAKILGRVCMDIIIIDITDISNVKVGEEVVVLGKSGNKIIRTSDIASIFDGSDYELLTRINPLIKKFYR